MDIFILRNGEQSGPFSEQNVQTLLNQEAVRITDMAWRKGLPAWLPLSEVLNPGSEKRSEPPPAMQLSGIKSAPVTAKAPTGKQRALLKYLGVEFPEAASKEELAVLVSDAVENPKLQARLSKWGDEKLRLHSDVFADEIEHRKGNRGGIYVERCQTEGEGVVKDVTKAHCQVLIESLDKRFPAWESNSKDALWHYFLPAVAEHFPMLVLPEWKSKLRFGSTPKSAPAKARATGNIDVAPEPGPSALQAVARGIFYGLGALGIIIGAMTLLKPGEPPVTGAVSTPPVAPTPPPAKTPEPAAVPAEAPLIAAVDPVPAPQPEPAVPAPAEPPPAEPVPAVPAPAPAPAPMVETPPAVPAIPPVNPVPPGPATLPRADGPATTPPAPMNTTPAAPVAPVAPVAAPAPKSVLTLTKPVSIQLQFGRVTLQPGTKMRLLGGDPGGLKCNFNNNIIVVPAASTDYDGSPLPAPTAAPTVPPGVPATPGGSLPIPKPVTPSDL